MGNVLKITTKHMHKDNGQILMKYKTALRFS